MVNAAGYVAPMAVMVAPNRVDYSVTKGGVKLWAVLLVFVVLCSSFYTMFSTVELAEVAFEIDGDADFDCDGDIDDDANEMEIHNRRIEKDTTPSREYVSGSRTFEENQKAHQPIQDLPDSVDDNRIEDGKLEEEEARLASLGAKAKRNSNKLFGKVVENAYRDDNDNDNATDNGNSDGNDDNKVLGREAGRHVKEKDKTNKEHDEGHDKPKQDKEKDGEVANAEKSV